MFIVFNVGKENNFQKHINGVNINHLGTQYDYLSVMHYHKSAFAIDPGRPTIIPHNPDVQIGQRSHLSDTDIERIQLLYGCKQAEENKT